MYQTARPPTPTPVLRVQLFLGTCTCVRGCGFGVESLRTLESTMQGRMHPTGSLRQQQVIIIIASVNKMQLWCDQENKVNDNSVKIKLETDQASMKAITYTTSW